MRSLLCVLDSRTGSADAAEMAAIDKFNEDPVRNGHWVMGAGLAALSATVLVDTREAVGIALAASRSRNRRVEMRPFLPPSPTPQ
jgi:hypothetical protein